MDWSVFRPVAHAYFYTTIPLLVGLIASADHFFHLDQYVQLPDPMLGDYFAHITFVVALVCVPAGSWLKRTGLEQIARRGPGATDPVGNLLVLLILQLVTIGTPACLAVLFHALGGVQWLLAASIIYAIVVPPILKPDIDGLYRILTENSAG